jgi:hypothetical protein
LSIFAVFKPSNTSDSSAGDEPWYSGNTVYYSDTITYRNGNYTLFDRERQALRVLVWIAGNDTVNDRFRVQCNIVSEEAAKYPSSGTISAQPAARATAGLLALCWIAFAFFLF